MQLADVNALKEFSKEKFVKKVVIASEKGVMNLLCYEAQQELPLHRHEASDEFFYVLEGEGLFSVGEEKLVVKAGIACVAPCGVMHGIKNSGKARLAVLSLQAPKP